MEEEKKKEKAKERRGGGSGRCEKENAIKWREEEKEMWRKKIINLIFEYLLNNNSK